MKKTLCPLAPSLVLLLAVTVQRAEADLIIGNLPHTGSGLGNTIAQVGFQKAVVFTTGSTGFTVDNVIL